MGGALELLAKIAGWFGGWFSAYSSKKNTEARVIESEKKEQDEFNKALQEKDLDRIRRDLS